MVNKLPIIKADGSISFLALKAKAYKMKIFYHQTNN